jgi:ubiquinone/menaquinone biosynthesis C-methylase UbiE
MVKNKNARTHTEAQIELHKKLAPRYAVRYSFEYSRVYQEDWHEAMIRHVPDEARKVLDLCCGSGFLLDELEQKKPGAVGLDISFEMLQVAAEYVPGARLITADAEKMPFKPGSFDAVVCKGSLHHTRDHVAFLRHSCNILRKGGRLVISEPCNDNPVFRLARAALYKVSPYFEVGDQGFTRKQMIGLYEEAGFNVVTIKRYGFLGYIFSAFPDLVPMTKYIPGNVLMTKFFVAFDRMLCKLPLLSLLAFQIVVVGEKRD